MVVACPNLASLQARIGGDRWFHQDVPRHLTHFTASGLQLLLERSCFRLERVSHLVVEQNPLGMWQTLLNRITAHPNVAFRALKRDPDGGPGLGRDLVLTAIAGPFMAPAAIALELAAGLAGRGGSVVAVGRRDLAGQDHLHAGEQRVGGARLAADAGVLQDQHAAVGLLGGDQSARFHHQPLDVVEVPDHRLAARHRLAGDHALHHLPQRGHGVLVDALVVLLAHRLEIVLAAGLRRSGRGGAHGALLGSGSGRLKPSGCSPERYQKISIQ